MACNKYKKSTLRGYHVGSQTLATNDLVAYQNFVVTGTSIDRSDNTSATIENKGMYSVTFNGTAVESGTTGSITVSLENNGSRVLGATASEYSGGTAGVVNLAFSTVIEILPSCSSIDNSSTLSVVNTGVGATFTNANLTITKLC